MIKQPEHEINEREKKLYVENILDNTFRFYKKEKEKLIRKRADCSCHPNQKCIYSISFDNLKEAEEKAINGIVYLMWQPTPVVERDLKAVFEQPLDEAMQWFKEKQMESYIK